MKINQPVVYARILMHKSVLLGLTFVLPVKENKIRKMDQAKFQMDFLVLSKLLFMQCN